jgi:colicin import membrane protein
MTDVIEWNLAGEVLQTAADTAAIDLLQENASKEAAAMFASAEEADAREKVESDAVAKEVADTAMRFLAQENASKEAAAMFASAEEADARAKVEADAVAKEAADTAMRVLAESAAKLAKDARVVFDSMQPVNDKVGILLLNALLFQLSNI